MAPLWGKQIWSSSSPDLTKIVSGSNETFWKWGVSKPKSASGNAARGRFPLLLR